MKKDHYLAFNKEWFERHQNKLLWLLRFRLFRYLLRIETDRPIVEILPNAYTVYLGKEDGSYKLQSDFRTHWKYSKRLYFAFKPLWWAMHIWDLPVDALIPKLSFGFSTLTRFPNANGDASPTTFDGQVGVNGQNTDWATLIAAANSVSSTSETATSGTCAGFAATTTNPKWGELYKAIFLFDTSALTSSATISAAVMSLFGTGKNDEALAPNTPTIDIYTSTTSSNTSITTTDSVGSTSQTGSAMAYASYSTVAYNDFTFNATGIGNVSKTSISKFGTRNANYDVAATTPTWRSGGVWYFTCNFADATGTSNDPKLVVTYTLASLFLAPRRLTQAINRASTY